MLKYDLPLAPDNGDFSEAAKIDLDWAAKSFQDRVHTEAADSRGFQIGNFCARFVGANADSETASAIGETLIANMSPELVDGFCHGFNVGWDLERLAGAELDKVES